MQQNLAGGRSTVNVQRGQLVRRVNASNSGPEACEFSGGGIGESERMWIDWTLFDTCMRGLEREGKENGKVLLNCSVRTLKNTL